MLCYRLSSIILSCFLNTEALWRKTKFDQNRYHHWFLVIFSKTVKTTWGSWPLQRPLSNPMLVTVTMHGKLVQLSAEANIPKCCTYGTCKSDSWYLKTLEAVVEFFRFPKGKNPKKDVRYRKNQCGKPHGQVNPSKINKSTIVSMLDGTQRVGPASNKCFEITFTSG